MWQWVADNLMRWMEDVVTISLLPALCVLVAGATLRRASSIAGVLLYAWSLFALITCWVVSAVVAYSIWGWTGFIIGIIFAGVGVIPLALLASLVDGAWIRLGLVCYYLALGFVGIGLSGWLLHHGDAGQAPTLD